MVSNILILVTYKEESFAREFSIQISLSKTGGQLAFIVGPTIVCWIS